MNSILSWPTLAHVHYYLSNPGLQLHPVHVTAALRRVQALSKGVAYDNTTLRHIVAVLLGHLLSNLPTFQTADLAQCLFHLGQLRERPAPEAAIPIITALKGRLSALPAARSVVETLWALRRLEMADREVMEEGRVVALERIGQLDAKHLAMLTTTLASAGIYNWSSFNLIMRATVSCLPDMSHAQLCAITSAFARVGHSDEAFFEVLADAASRRIESCQPTHLAQLTNAFARIRHRNQRFFSRAAAKAQKLMHLFTAKEVAVLAHAYATLRIYDPVLYDSLCARALQVMAEMQPRHLSCLAWAIGRQGHRNELLLQALAQAALEQLPQLEAVHITNLASTFGQFGFPHQELFAGLAQVAGDRIEKELYELAESRQRAAEVAEAPQTPEALMEQQMDLLDEPAAGDMGFQAHQLAFLSRAMGSVGYKDERLMGYLCALAMAHLPQCTPKALADLVWGCAQLGLHSNDLMDAVAKEASARLPSFAPEQFGDLLWAFAQLQHQSPELHEAASAVVMEVVDQLRAGPLAKGELGELARLVWCFNTLGWQHDGLSAVFAEVAPAQS